MNAMQALTKRILENPFAYEWQMQGFGMLRLYLTKEIRLHIWDPSHKAEGVSMIHDHPWDFRSHILAGKLTNIVYSPKRKSVNHPFPTHYLQRIVCGPGGGKLPHEAATPMPLDHGEEYSMPIYQRREYEAGAEYGQIADQVHETDATPGTVTLIERVFTQKHPDHASVYVPLGQPWGSAEPRKADKWEVEAFVTKARERFNELAPVEL